MRVKGKRGEDQPEVGGGEDEYKMELVWRNIIGMIYLHYGALIGLYLWFSGQVHWQTIIFGELITDWWSITYVNCLKKYLR